MAYSFVKDDLTDKLKEIKATIRTKNLKPYYFLYGNEDYFIDEILKGIKKTFVDDSKLNYKKYTADTFEFKEIVKYIQTLPFMNDKKLILFEDIPFFKNDKKNNKEDIELFLKTLDENKEFNIIVVVNHDSISGDDKYKKNYGNDNQISNFFKKNGFLVDLHKLKEEELNIYVVNKFAKAKKNIDKIESAYLIRNVGKNLKSLFNECDKIIAYVGNKDKILRSDIDAIITKNIDENVFNLINYANNNKINDAISLYGDLISEGENSRNIFNRFSINYNNLLIIKSYMEKSKGQNEIAKLVKMEPWQVEKLMSANRFVNKETLIAKVNKSVDLSFSCMRNDIDANMIAELLFLR